MDKDDIVSAVRQALDERSTIDKDIHKKHHKFIEMQMDEFERKRTRNEKVKQQVIGWGAITAIGGIGYLMWEGVKRLFHQ